MAKHAVAVMHIATELSAGRLVGPTPQTFHGMLHTRLMGFVHKGHYTGTSKWKVIIDLSSPRRAIVNDSISEHQCSLWYASVYDLWRLIRSSDPYFDS